MSELRGLTWSHSRGYCPVVAGGQLYEDRHPGFQIAWEKRSLHDFGQGSLESLAEIYDLIVLDHPIVGTAARAGLLVPLDDHIERALIERLAHEAVGPCHASYRWEDSQWALAIDAAHQVAVWPEHGSLRPGSWDEVVDAATQGAPVALPLAPADAYGAFLSLYGHLAGLDGGQQFRLPFDHGAATSALTELRRLTDHLDPRWLEVNTIEFLRIMSESDGIQYCPLVYSYSNYSREGFASRRLHFGEFVFQPGDEPAGSILGGAGIALTSGCRHPQEAAKFAAWLAGAECQRTIYTLAGGQPANRAAWEDESLDRLCAGFFSGTRSSLDLAGVRPNFPGFHSWQEYAIRLVHGGLIARRPPRELIDGMNEAYEGVLR